MALLSRRQIVGAAAAAAVLPGLNWMVPARAKTPVRYASIADLPMLELDVQTSIEKGRLTTKGQHYANMPIGAVIMVPAGAEIPAPWWSMRFRKTSAVRDGARFVLRGGDPQRRPLLAAPGGEGVMDLSNGSGQAVAFDLEHLAIRAGKGGDAIRVSAAERVRLKNVAVEGGKNGVFAVSDPTDLEMIDCDIRYSGRGGGKTHTFYANYIRNLVIRNCRITSPRALGHVFKCYAQHLDIRDSYLAQYETEAEFRDGFYGGLPLFDRGAWGSTIAVGNTFVRRGPPRSMMIELRNRAYPPGYSKWVKPGWGTAEVDFRQVDNRDPTNPHLFRHLFYQNRVQNGVLPDGGIDPRIAAEPGTMLRNNGSAPWGVMVKGKVAGGSAPPGWKPHHERAVAYLVENTVEGVPFARIGDPTPHTQPGLRTPIHELDSLPEWAADWIKS